VLRVTPSVGDHNASRDKHRDPGATGHAGISHDRARALRREVLLMRAFQSRITGSVLRRVAGPQNILEMDGVLVLARGSGGR
jgi:hypothetical protein